MKEEIIEKLEQFQRDIPEGRKDDMEYILYIIGAGMDEQLLAEMGKEDFNIVMKLAGLKLPSLLENLDPKYDVNYRSKSGITALIIASYLGCEESARALLKKGADVNSAMNDGTTALMYAANKGYREVIELLLDEGAYPNVKTVSGTTALEHANFREHDEIAGILRAAGAKD